MKDKLDFILICFFFVSYLSHTQSNENVVDRIVDDFHQLTENQSKDEVYLQTSKGVYETEEDFWFKAYVLETQTFYPSLRSATLFVQLIEDRTNEIAWEEKYQIENGFVSGHLFLNDSLQSGSYTLAAYSAHSFYRNMQEFNGLRKIRIVENIKNRPKPRFILNDSILNFNTFPEGGYLVSGLENKLAFKAENSKLLPIDVSGTLYENNIPIVDFKSSHNGMGSFIFSPNAKSSYHIRLTEPKRDEVYRLPKILPSGKTLELEINTKDYAVFKILQTSEFQNETVYLRVQSRGVIYNMAVGNLNKELKVKIPLKEMPQGIAEVTLFNKSIKPVAERLIYVNPQRKINISAKLDKSEYKTREKVNLKIKVTDEKDTPISAHFGLSVFDHSYDNPEDSNNILTHFYLSTQLKGKIYNPSYYFDNRNKDRHEALDLLLMTQGWRRYVWNKDDLSEHVEPLLSDSIVGKVVPGTVSKKSKTDRQKGVIAFTADSLKGNDLIISDFNGAFSITSKHLALAEKSFLYLKPLTPEKPKNVISIKDTSFDIINENKKRATIDYPFVKTEKENVTKDYDFIVSNEANNLEEVIISTKKKRVFRDKYLGILDSLAKLDINNDFVCIHNSLNCFIHGRTGSRRPVDGEIYTVHVNDGQELDEFYPHNTWDKNIQKKYRYPRFTEADLLKKFNLTMLKGYYGKREFYQPVYDKGSLNDPFPDYRNTLFWKPDLITNEQGEATVEFYCSDINTIFLGNIEGVSGNGLIGAQNFKFNVLKTK